MTAAQSVFLALLTLVALGIVAFAVVVARSAIRVDGGAFPTAAMLTRLGRSPHAHAELNRWAFYLHRITGFGILAFLALHVLDVSSYAVSPALFADIHRIYGTVPMRVFECLLLFALLFHACNGLRIIAIDIGDLGGRSATRLLGGAVAVTAVLGLAGSVVILAPLID